MPSDVGEWTNNINANKGHGVGKDSGFRRSRPALRELPTDSTQGLLMPLSLREQLTMLMPPSVFYRQRIAQEARTGEPELAVLAELVPRGGIAVDVGANVGFFAYALADIADRVVAFEPNPDYAFFARWMLLGRAEVREIALSEWSPATAAFSEKRCCPPHPCRPPLHAPAFVAQRLPSDTPSTWFV
jgi:hypothetical protein